MALSAELLTKLRQKAHDTMHLNFTWRRVVLALLDEIERLRTRVQELKRDRDKLQRDVLDLMRQLGKAEDHSDFVVFLNHDDCRILMHGLCRAKDLQGELVPGALKRYEELTRHIALVGWGVALYHAEDDEGDA